jgi:hypothetical protein
MIYDPQSKFAGIASPIFDAADPSPAINGGSRRPTPWQKG